MTSPTQTKRPGATLLGLGVLIGLIFGALLVAVSISGGSPTVVVIAGFLVGVGLVVAGLARRYYAAENR